MCCSALDRDIRTPSEAQQLLDVVEPVIAFVSNTGGSLISHLNDEKLGRMKVSQYIQDVLLVPQDESIGFLLSKHLIQLKHLEALFVYLTERTTCDVFGKVHEAYKKPLRSEYVTMSSPLSCWLILCELL